MSFMKQICIATLALAASCGALAAEDPTRACIDALAGDSRLAPLADKVALVRGAPGSAARAIDRVATEQERAAVAVWMEKRNECFDAGAQHRRASSQPQDRAFVRSVFVFQQRLVADLQAGRLTYDEFNRRRGELSASAGEEI